MKRYDTYKDSGIDWLGQIPPHWQVKRLKDVVNINTETLKEDTPSDYTFKYIDISNVTSDGIITLSEDMTFYESPSRARRIIHKGDVIVSTVRTYLKAIAPINFNAEDIIVSTGFAVLTPNNIESNYLMYLMRNSSAIDQICSQSTGVSYPAISAGKISAINIIIPPIEEQRAIADYLDEKTAEIDGQVELLEKKRKAYERLKTSVINHAVTHGLNPDVAMRPSGIDWLGDIPIHWQVKRLKDITNLLTKKSTSEIKVGLENIESGTGKFILSDSEYNGNGVEFIKQDIVYGKLRPYLRKVWLAEFSGNAVGDFFVFRAIGKNNPLYIKYLMLSDGFTAECNSSTFGAKMPRVAPDFIRGLSCAVPPIEEQRAIATYLDEKCSEIDAAIENIGKQIDAYKRLKRALINEVVTGQRAV